MHYSIYKYRHHSFNKLETRYFPVALTKDYVRAEYMYACLNTRWKKKKKEEDENRIWNKLFGLVFIQTIYTEEVYSDTLLHPNDDTKYFTMPKLWH